MVSDLLAYLHKEWRVLKRAPGIFGLAVVLGLVVGAIVTRWFYSEWLAALRDEVSITQTLLSGARDQRDMYQSMFENENKLLDFQLEMNRKLLDERKSQSENQPSAATPTPQ